MEVKNHFQYIEKCGLDGYRILSQSRGGFVGALNLLQTLNVVVHLVDLV